MLLLLLFLITVLKERHPSFLLKKILILLFASIVYSSGIDFYVGLGLFVCCGKVSL